MLILLFSSSFLKSWFGYQHITEASFHPILIHLLLKEDLDFRRFLLRGKEKVKGEWLLFSLALNILKLHHKIQNERLGTALFIPKDFPASL
ncbi:MAG: transposase [Clostridia bacterium]|nr:transposase [Clostridia bacterium]